MMVPGIGGWIRSRPGGWMRRCGSWEGRISERARTLVASYKDNKQAESKTAGTRRLQFVPDERRSVLATYSPPPSATHRRCRHHPRATTRELRAKLARQADPRDHPV